MKNRTVWEIASSRYIFIIGIAWYIVRQRLRMQRDRTNHYLLLTEKANSEYKALTERVKKQQTTESYLRDWLLHALTLSINLERPTMNVKIQHRNSQSYLMKVKQIITDFAENNGILQELEKS